MVWKAHLLPAGVDVERANVAGRRGQPLGDDRTEDQQIAIEHTRRVDADAERARIAPFKALTQDRSGRPVRNCGKGLPVFASSAYSQWREAK